MKILQLIQKSQLRGAEMFASQLSNHLVEAGHQVLMVSLLPGTSELPFKGNHVKLQRPLSKRFIDWQGWKQLAQEIKNFEPDVVQANAGDTLKFAVFSKLFFQWKAPIVFRNANKVSDFINTTPKLLFNKFLVHNMRHVISVSELCRQDFLKTYAYNNSKTTTLPIGINLLQVNRTIPPDLISFFASGKILVHVASFVPEKNHSGLIKILHKLVDSGEDVKVIMIGDGKLRTTVEHQLVDMKLAGRVLVAGYRTDVLSIVANAQAFVLPSLIEGLPGVILEAMYCRTPVIAYNVGGISEVVRKETGWLVKAGDEDGFAKDVKQVLGMSKEELNTITENAHQLVVREYDNKVIAQRFLEVYKKVSGILL
ncbi:MAG: glycosyltransferase [Cyclobacteriaceae bacterium]|nr:glycosyltransferase [Cyclobacteriaceae bacterium]